MSEQMKQFGFRAEEKKIETAKKLGIDLSELIRSAIDKAIAETKGKCPTCGQKVKL